jgi:hypothetical protein
VARHRYVAGRLDRVERERQCVGQQLEGRAERRSQMGGASLVSRSGRLAEPHQIEEQLRRVPRREIGELVDGHAVEAPLQRRQDQRQRLGDEAGATARAVDRRPTFGARRLNAGARLGIDALRPVELAARGHHVGARCQQPAHVVDIQRAGHVEDAVGALGDDGVDVVGRDHAYRTRPTQLACVLAGLVGRVHPDADQFQTRVVDHRTQRPGTDVARGPLDDSVLLHGRSMPRWSRSVAPV